MKKKREKKAQIKALEVESCNPLPLVSFHHLATICCCIYNKFIYRIMQIVIVTFQNLWSIHEMFICCCSIHTFFFITISFIDTDRHVNRMDYISKRRDTHMYTHTVIIFIHRAILCKAIHYLPCVVSIFLWSFSDVDSGLLKNDGLFFFGSYKKKMNILK